MWWDTLNTTSPWLLQWGVPLGVALAAAATDMRSRRIPNALTVPAWGAGLLGGAWVGGWAGFVDAGAASVMLAAPFVLLFLFAGGGAGDAKLMLALGAWLGVRQGVLVLPAVLLAGGVVGVAFALTQRRLGVVAHNLAAMVSAWLLTPSGGGRRMPMHATTPSAGRVPYGLAICLGVSAAWGMQWLVRW